MKKDKISLYLARNILAVFMITVVSMYLSIVDYYQCELAEGLQRVFVYNIMTLLYLLLLCSLNYCIFELCKVIMDLYEKFTQIPIVIAFVIIAFIFKNSPIHSLFQYNFFFLTLLIALRIFKQLYKKRSLK